MISYVKGILSEVNEDGIVVENGNIGYEIKVPLSVMDELPSLGGNIKTYTYLYVREDALCLYGFLSKDDLEVFKLLIAVNGIGPKAALGILSSISPDDLRFAVLSDDVKTISKAPGIGAKTAGKLILELKDKFKLQDAFEHKIMKQEAQTQHTSSDSAVRSEAVQALATLGYSNTEAWKAVRQVELTEGMDVETLLKLSLKKISLF